LSYSTAITELRQLLGDTEFHKKATNKRILGAVDGVNTLFFTYDKRIMTNTFQAFVNGVEVQANVDDEIKGQITLANAPDINSKVNASYYWRFWLDEELQNFLNKGAESTGQFTSLIPDNAYLSIQPGLKQAALFFASNMAIKSLIQFMINRRHSEEFLLEQDNNSDSNFSSMITALNAQAKSFWDEAVFHRDDFYKRLGKRNAPAFGVKTVKLRKYGAFR